VRHPAGPEGACCRWPGSASVAAHDDCIPGRVKPAPLPRPLQRVFDAKWRSANYRRGAFHRPCRRNPTLLPRRRRQTRPPPARAPVSASDTPCRRGSSSHLVATACCRMAGLAVPLHLNYTRAIPRTRTCVTVCWRRSPTIRTGATRPCGTRSLPVRDWRRRRGEDTGSPRADHPVLVPFDQLQLTLAKRARLAIRGGRAALAHDRWSAKPGRSDSYYPWKAPYERRSKVF
jgi:hypothetical protein